VVPHEVPLENIRSKLSPGIQIVVRYLNKGRLIGFRAKLIEAIFTPQRLMFLEYPKTFEHHDIRSIKRVNCTLAVTMTIGNYESKGTMLDISRKGCRCLTSTTKEIKLLSIKKEEQISFRCQFPGVQDDQVVTGNIKNIKMDKQETAIGIQFQKMGADVKGIIDRYISSIEKFS
jgi:c-di-GMP-binding flagellar brake protein YcgR